MLRAAVRQSQQESLPQPERKAPWQDVFRSFGRGGRKIPGPAGAGACFTMLRATAAASRFREADQHVGEYEGLLLGLKHARELGYRRSKSRRFRSS